MADTDTHWRPSPTQSTSGSEREKKVPGIPHPREKVGVPDNFIKQSCCLFLHSVHKFKRVLRSSTVNAHTPSADTHV